MKILKWLHVQNIHNASAIPFLSQSSNFFSVFPITTIRKNIKCKVHFFIIFQNRNNRNSHNVNKLIIDIITNMTTWLRFFQIIIVILGSNKIVFAKKVIAKRFHSYHLHYTRYFFLNHRYSYRFYTIIFLTFAWPNANMFSRTRQICTNSSCIFPCRFVYSW